jgi:hypothetical protein
VIHSEAGDVGHALEVARQAVIELDRQGDRYVLAVTLSSVAMMLARSHPADGLAVIAIAESGVFGEYHSLMPGIALPELAEAQPELLARAREEAVGIGYDAAVRRVVAILDRLITDEGPHPV